MCEENTESTLLDEVRAVSAHKRFFVNAHKSEQVLEYFDTAEEAADAAVALVREGFTSVNVRDTAQDDIW